MGLVLSPINAVITGKSLKWDAYISLKRSCLADGHNECAYLALMEVTYDKTYDVYSFDNKYYNFNYDLLKKILFWCELFTRPCRTILKNDEIIVYKEEQIIIKSLVELLSS